MSYRYRTIHLPNGRGERLEWYRWFVRNRTVAGSLFTLLHLPFMLAFLSLVLVGAAFGGPIDGVVLGLSLLVVAVMLYAEHMLDETTMVGKPWNTVLGDRQLVGMAVLLFVIALGAGAYVTLDYGTWVPLAGVVLGVLFTVLYGLEVKGFHTTWFGGIGMGAVTPFAYLAQTLMLGRPWDPVLAGMLLVLGSCYGYLLLSLYESTKTPDHRLFWKLLAVQFILVYALAATCLLRA